MSVSTEKYKVLLPAHLSDEEKDKIVNELFPLAELSVNEFLKRGPNHEA